jgi:Sigma-70 region 2
MRSDFLSRLISKPASAAARVACERPAPTAADDWGGLMAAAQNGNGGAYRRLLGEISVWLTRYFQRRLPPGEVDDAVQETLLAVHRRRHTYDPQYALGPWSAAIAKRKWIDQLRSLGRRPTEELSQDLSIPDHEMSLVSSSVAVAATLGHGMHEVLKVFGVWASLSGLLQLATGVRRWKSYGAQWAMILSGAQSALAGVFILKQAAGAQAVSIASIAPYAAFGALYFLISAISLTVSDARRRSKIAAA